MHKIGLKLWSTNTDFYLFVAKKLYAQKIFDYVELYVVPDSLNCLEQWANFDVPYIIHCPHFAHGFCLSDKDKESYNKELYQQTKKYADTLNVQYIIFHPGIGGDYHETARQLKGLQEARALVENKPYKVPFSDENKKYCQGYSKEELSYIVSETQCGFCMDIGHALCAANSQGINPYEYFEQLLLLKPKMFHLSDVRSEDGELDAHLHFGTGKLNFEKVVEILPKDVVISIETVKDSKENLDDYVRDVDFLRGLLK